MKIYTKTGDAGQTSLICGERVGKDDCRVEAYGSVDELSAFIAYLRDNIDLLDIGELSLEEYRDDLRNILSALMKVEAVLAYGSGEGKTVEPVSAEEVGYLETRIDYISEQLVPLTRFTIPGGHPVVSLAHICRTVCRRAEREAIRAANEHEIESNTMAYLNRLSDYLYQLGRKLADALSVEEEYWNP